MRTTPENIVVLAPGEVFVFGSNLAGRHGSGAARTARELFGAQYGKGEGLTGRCYAFPTLGTMLQRRTLPALRKSRDRFFGVALLHPELTFLLTRVGTGLAGYEEKVMITLFADSPASVVKPEGW